MITIKEHATRAEWLETRKGGIGGSDVAAILGLSKYRSPLDVYLSRVEGVAVEENEAMSWGNRLEPVVAAEYERRFEVDFKPLSFPIFKNSAFPHALASPDRIIDGQDKGVEIKTVGYRAGTALDDSGNPIWGDEDTDYVPSEYAIQCQYYMMVTGFREWDLAALIGGQQFRRYKLRADNELQEMMAKTVEEFWKRLEDKNPPPPKNENERAEILKLVANKKNNLLDVTNSDSVVMQAILNLREARIEFDAAEERLLQCENDVKEFIGEADGLTWIDEYHEKRLSLTWKQTKPSTKTDWKALATALKPPPELWNKYTSTAPGSRRLLVPKEWKESEVKG